MKLALPRAHVRIPGIGVIALDPDKGQALIPGSAIFATRLQAQLLGPDGAPLEEARDLHSGLVTTAGVVYLAADFAGGGSDASAFNWHAVGIGTTAPVIGNTAMENVTGAPARVSGTQSTPGSTNIYRSVATVAFTSTLAITEWGLLSAVTAGTLWDRKTFSAINVINGDSIQFTYDLTIAAGG